MLMEANAMTRTARQFDADARWGNDRIRRAEFIRERMRQTGCLAIEAARLFEAERRSERARENRNRGAR